MGFDSIIPVSVSVDQKSGFAQLFAVIDDEKLQMYDFQSKQIAYEIDIPKSKMFLQSSYFRQLNRRLTHLMLQSDTQQLAIITQFQDNFINALQGQKTEISFPISSTTTPDAKLLTVGRESFALYNGSGQLLSSFYTGSIVLELSGSQIGVDGLKFQFQRREDAETCYNTIRFAQYLLSTREQPDSQSAGSSGAPEPSGCDFCEACDQLDQLELLADTPPRGVERVARALQPARADSHLGKMTQPALADDLLMHLNCVLFIRAAESRKRYRIVVKYCGQLLFSVLCGNQIVYKNIVLQDVIVQPKSQKVLCVRFLPMDQDLEVKSADFQHFYTAYKCYRQL